MKNVIFAFVILLSGCTGCQNGTYVQPVTAGYTQPIVQQQQYEYIQSPQGQQMVVMYDGATQFMVDYAIFNSLGYGGVMSYYHSHPGYYQNYNRNTYSSWRTTRTFGSPAASPMQRTNSLRSTGAYSSPPAYRNTTPQPVRTNSFRSSGGYTPSYRSTTPSSPARSSSFRRH